MTVQGGAGAVQGGAALLPARPQVAGIGERRKFRLSRAPSARQSLREAKIPPLTHYGRRANRPERWKIRLSRTPTDGAPPPQCAKNRLPAA